MGRAPRTKETLPDFLKWRRVTRPPLVFRGLTVSQRTPGFWGVTLSRRPESSLSHMRLGYLPLLVDLRALGVILEVEDSGALLATFHVRPLLVDQILVGQSQDPQMIKLKEEIEKGKKAEFQIRDDGMIVKGQRMCVPEYGELKRDIMKEAHSSAYPMHPGSTKMYKTLKEHYWWNGMKKEIASFISKCLTCQQVKA